jgi:hypothetical protein
VELVYDTPLAAYRTGRKIELVERTGAAVARPVRRARPVRARGSRGATAGGLPVVVWTEQARREMFGALDRTNDGRETGGALFGYTEPGRIVLTAACGPGMAERDRYSITINVHNFLAVERQIYDVGWLWRGDWHTHPAGGEKQSAADRSTSQKYRYVTKEPVWVSVIVIPGDPTRRDGEWGALHASRLLTFLTTADGVHQLPTQTY